MTNQWIILLKRRGTGSIDHHQYKTGKGASMKDGVLVAKNEVIAFLDADIVTFPKDVIELLTAPLLNSDADFVKSYFTRQAGRVTELVAKPLLSILHPTFPNFRQPLSGMIAGRKIFSPNVNLRKVMELILAF